MMRVLQINAVYGQGSTGTIVRDIEILCEESGIESYVASPDINVLHARRGYLIGSKLDHKIHAALSRINGEQAYFSHIPTIKLLKYLDSVKPDIVHLHNLHSNFVNLNMLLKYLAEQDIKTVITLHDCWFYTGGCFHYTSVGCDKWLKQCGNCPKKKVDTPSLLFDRSSRILADRKKYLLSVPRLYITGVSEWMANEALKTFLRNTPNYVIHNGVDLEIFKPIPSDFRKRLGLEDKYVILGPASKWLLPVNREVLEYFSNNMKSDEVLLLFGVYQDPGQLPANVIPYGYTKDRKELAELYSMADVFANTTREDSLSLINVESQACGTPVVTFDQTGPKETVDNIYSFSVQVGNAEKLYNAIEKIRTNFCERDFVNCRKFVESKYNMRKKYLEYLDLYKEIFNK